MTSEPAVFVNPSQIWRPLPRVGLLIPYGRSRSLLCNDAVHCGNRQQSSQVNSTSSGNIAEHALIGNRWAKYATRAFIILQVVVNVLAFIAFYAQCGVHLSTLWHPAEMSLHPGYCMAVSVQTEIGYVQGAFNCLTDAYLTVLPGMLIEHTKLSIKKKIGLACLLCLSIIALTASIGKTYEAKALSEVADYSCEYNCAAIQRIAPMLTCYHR